MIFLHLPTYKKWCAKTIFWFENSLSEKKTHFIQIICSMVNWYFFASTLSESSRELHWTTFKTQNMVDKRKQGDNSHQWLTLVQENVSLLWLQDTKGRQKPHWGFTWMFNAMKLHWTWALNSVHCPGQRLSIRNRRSWGYHLPDYVVIHRGMAG